VRELKNVVQRAFIMGDEEIGPEALPIADVAPVAAGERASIQVKVGTRISDAERALILATLEMLGDDKKKTAEVLGLSLKTLYNRLNVYAASGALVRERDAGSTASVAGDPGHDAGAD
jgi:DNA-binding NtrC family response regulator